MSYYDPEEFLGISVAESIEIRSRIDEAWDTKSAKMDWLGMEDALVKILKSPWEDRFKVALCRETIDAFTKRGHF